MKVSVSGWQQAFAALLFAASPLLLVILYNLCEVLLWPAASPWNSPLLAHAALVLFVWVFFPNFRKHWVAFGIPTVWIASRPKIPTVWISLVLSLGLLGGSVIFALVQPLFGGSLPGEVVWPDTGSVVASCLLIPLVEECFFRGVMSAFLRKHFPAIASSISSVLLFGAMHATQSVPLGPLLLGGICEYLRYREKSLLGPILFHSAANFTVIIFLWIDIRGLQMLTNWSFYQ